MKSNWQNKIENGCIKILYHVDLEKRGGCGVVARERQESHMSQ